MTRRWGRWPSSLERAPAAGLVVCVPPYLVVLAIACVIVPGCQPPSSSASAKAAPAKPTTAKEADLGIIKLKPEEEARLGVALAEAVRKPVPRTATYGGIVEVPTGGLIIVASPFNGTLRAASGAGTNVLTPGHPVKEGQTIFTLIPMLSPEAQATMTPALIQAEGQVKQFTEQVKIAKVNLDRAEKLAQDRLGGSASVVDARAQYELVQAQLRAAEKNRESLAQVTSDAASGEFNAQAIASPANGVIQVLHALPGQKVQAGAPLFNVASLDPVWVRVPVFVGDLAKLAVDRDAEVGGLADSPGASTLRGKPITAPPSGDPLSATVNVYYEVENKDFSLRTGQRVGVTLPMKGEDESLTVPRAALLRDIHGNAWVYEKTGDHAYTRRLIMVDRTVGDLAVLAGGKLKPGAKVVTDGAAELFGTEFGGFK